MKVVHIIFSLETGGAETMLVDIVNEQTKTDSVSLIIVNNKINEDVLSNISKNIKLYMIGRKRKNRNPIPLIKLNLLLLKLKPDYIHCHNYNMIDLIFAKKLLKYRIGLTVHDIGKSTKYHHGYGKIFAISQAVQKDIKSRCEFDSIIVNNGINFKKIKNQRNIESKIFKIIQVSRLEHEKKGQDILIKALAILINKRKVKNIKLDFIGEGQSHQYLKTLVIEYKLESFVNFLGLKSRDYIYQNLCNYNLFVQPSLYEGFGLTVVEAIAAKISVLVSDIHGPMEIIERGKYGFYFESENEVDCADKIDKAIKCKNYDIIDSAYEHALYYYSIESTASKYLKEYNN